MSDNVAAVTPIVLTADNPRDKLKEITDRLEQGIRDVFESDRYKDYLKTLSKFHNYSFNNCLLIAMQKPDATLVAGYGAWRNNFKRNVMKGEKGIKIIAPSPNKTQKEMVRVDPQSGMVVIGKDGKPLTDQIEIIVPTFHIATVFDISQTEGNPLPEIEVNELTGNVEQYMDFFAAIEKTSPVPIFVESITSGAKGYFDLEKKRIVINGGMSELQTLKTAIHEIAHARLHDIDKNAPKDIKRPDNETREVEAESIAYVVCQHYELDTSDYSFGYIAGWSGSKELETLKSSLDTIRREANTIITEIDGFVTTIRKDRVQEALQELGEEVEATLKYFVDSDFERFGELSESTLEVLNVQGYEYRDGQLRQILTVPENIIQAIVKPDYNGALRIAEMPKPSIRAQLRECEAQVKVSASAPSRAEKDKELEV